MSLALNVTKAIGPVFDVFNTWCKTPPQCKYAKRHNTGKAPLIIPGRESARDGVRARERKTEKALDAIRAGEKAMERELFNDECGLAGMKPPACISK